ncbi:hypothetical protein E4U41_002103 [Claviceps citrina]|nr:hypothetical protein E4U41_002103 [Claviceps citrina]
MPAAHGLPRQDDQSGSCIWDALVIRKAHAEIQMGQYSQLASLLSPSVIAMAIGTLKTVSPAERRRLETDLLIQMNSGTSPLDSVPEMQTIVQRFHQDPLDSGSQLSDVLEQPPAHHSRHPPESRYPSDARLHPSYQNQRQPAEPFAYYPQSNHQFNPRRPVYGHSPAPIVKPVSRSANLKPEVLAFDSKVVNVSAYISKLEHLAETHGAEAVLTNIVPGLQSKPESDGCQWFNSLNPNTRQNLTWDLELWKTLLRQRFRKDRGYIIGKADDLKHTFATEEELPLQDYIDRKISLYNEAGGIDEDQIARRLVMGVDASLAKLIDTSAPTVTIDSVKQQLSARQWSAQRDWDETRKQITRQVKDSLRQSSSFRTSNGANFNDRRNRII